MIERMINEYEPDYVSCPGETLQDIIESLNMTQVDLAKRTGRPVKTISEIIRGKSAITPGTALQLEKVLKIPASFWNNREGQYREFLAKVEERKTMVRRLGWLNKLPINEMAKMGWIKRYKDGLQQLTEVLKFFGIASPEQWEQIWNNPSAAFRKSKAFRSDPHALSVWLRQGEIEAQNIQCLDYNPGTFKKALNKIRGLTTKEPDVFVPKMTELCSKSGVAVVFVPEIKNTSVWGATRWLSPRKALIQLSLRYKTNDHLWFSFFHEAGHILLYGKREVFIKCGDEHNDSEEKADNFSKNTLIPEKDYKEFFEHGDFSKKSIMQFAQKIGIAPGIVVGRLQHDGYILHSHFNHLKISLTWA